MSRQLKIALLCGGPSRERGISLNSSRSVCDHLSGPDIELFPFYFDFKKRPYELSRAQLYSNTPSDFDFKLARTATPLTDAALDSRLRAVDLVFPVMHGQFAEDGEIQGLLESLNRPFVGSSSAACARAFDKFDASEFLRSHGVYTIPCLKIDRSESNPLPGIEKFFLEHAIVRAVVKPSKGGSSIGVFSVQSAQEAHEKVQAIFNEGVDARVVIEPFCKGREFTVIIVENVDGLPVALLPTEVAMDYGDNQIFDYRRKYLATRQVSYFCPARFDTAEIAQIRRRAAELFTLLGMNDFARFDGWILDNGEIYFSDFNPISGMEQNSFLFIQASQLGMSHRDILRFVVESSCRRQGIAFPEFTNTKQTATRIPVRVIFGGDSAERHVSLMSGTNVWLKLRQSETYSPEPFLLDTDQSVWQLPYCLALYHTVEEISELCRATREREQRLAPLRAEVLKDLKVAPQFLSESKFTPRHLSLDEFVRESSVVFVALHGGIGENGELQKMLELSGVQYTGSGPEASRLCMDKYATGEALRELQHSGIFQAKKKLVRLSEQTQTAEQLFATLARELSCASMIVKPVDDGCSAGVAKIVCATDLDTYLRYARSGESRIPAHTLRGQDAIIEMPPHKPDRLLFENFVETAHLSVRGNDLIWPPGSPDWVEITVGVLGPQHSIRALNPSVTVASSHVLSLEEKFQGGTGINITPPPEEYVLPEVVTAARTRIEKVAQTLGIHGFARIDAFLNVKTGEIIVIEANSIPGLTPSTVIYHQALAENPPVYPMEFLERILEYRR